LTRSEQMSRIRSRGTRPEKLLAELLAPLPQPKQPQYLTPKGRADLAFPDRKVAVFVDGCQWHGCPEHYVRPRSNSSFWAEKLATNVKRDRRQTISLGKLGWRVVRVLEHEIFERPDLVLTRVQAALTARHFAPGTLWRVIAVTECKPVSGHPNEERRMISISRYASAKIELRSRRTAKWKRTAR
jgi:DNA mismatch endonuclease (patch repair protein)